jgi:hypothetical protein
MSIANSLDGLDRAMRMVPLASGQIYTVPAGQWNIAAGPYTFLQWYDSRSLTWKNLTTELHPGTQYVPSDGYNTRLANLTGTCVGAVVTNGGSAIAGVTSAIYPAGSALLSATADSGVTQFNVVVGGVINSTVTVTTAGAYNQVPMITFDPPPQGGVQATGHCVMSGTTISSVVVDNQGAGYTSVPKITITPQATDTAAGGGVLTATIDTATFNGKITALTLATSQVNLAAVSTITFGGTLKAGSPAATAIMCFTITTGVAQTSASHMGTGNVGFSIGATTAGSSTTTNPAITTGLFVPRIATTAFNTTAGGGITFLDGGLHQIIPTGIAYAVLSDGTISAASTAVAQTVGGVVDVTLMRPV